MGMEAEAAVHAAAPPKVMPCMPKGGCAVVAPAVNLMAPKGSPVVLCRSAAVEPLAVLSAATALAGCPFAPLELLVSLACTVSFGESGCTVGPQLGWALDLLPTSAGWEWG